MFFLREIVKKIVQNVEQQILVAKALKKLKINKRRKKHSDRFNMQLHCTTIFRIELASVFVLFCLFFLDFDVVVLLLLLLFVLFCFVLFCFVLFVCFFVFFVVVVLLLFFCCCC